MRMVVAFFIALLAIPIAQVAFDQWEHRAGPRLLGESRLPVAVAAGKHHKVRDLEFFMMLPRLERRPKTG
jgi:hypothetical protein